MTHFPHLSTFRVHIYSKLHPIYIIKLVRYIILVVGKLLQTCNMKGEIACICKYYFSSFLSYFPFRNLIIVTLSHSKIYFRYIFKFNVYDYVGKHNSVYVSYNIIMKYLYLSEQNWLSLWKNIHIPNNYNIQHYLFYYGIWLKVENSLTWW